MTCHIFFKVGQCVLTLSIDIQILSTGSPPPTHKKILFSNLLIYISFDHYLQFSISQIHSRALSYKNRTNFFFEVAPNVFPKINIIYIFYKWACEVKKYVRTYFSKKNWTFFGLSTACTTLCKIMTPQHFWGLNQRLDIISCQSLWKSKRFYAGPKTCPKMPGEKAQPGRLVAATSVLKYEFERPFQNFFSMKYFFKLSAGKNWLAWVKSSLY